MPTRRLIDRGARPLLPSQRRKQRPAEIAMDQTDDGSVIQVIDIVNQLASDFTDRDELYSYIDMVLFRDFAVRIPKAYQRTAVEIHSPLPVHIANTITAALSINAPTVQFPPVGFGDVYQENSTLREHFFEASWERQQQEAKRRLFRTFIYSLVTKGEAVYKTVERAKSAWAAYDQFTGDLQATLDADPSLDQATKDTVRVARGEEFKRAQPYPIATSIVPPGTFRYIRGEQGFTFACEVKQVPYYTALTRFEYGLDTNGRVVPEAQGLPRTQWGRAMGSIKLLTMVEAFTQDEIFYLLIGPGQAPSAGGVRVGHGTLVGRIAHGYGDPATRTLRGPYFQALGVTTDSTLPDRAGLSVLFGFLDLFPYLDSLLTIQSNAAYLTGFPAFKRTQPPGSTIPQVYGRDGSEDKPEQIEPGTIYPYDVAPIEQPASGRELHESIALVQKLLELALPSIVQGVVSGDESGYALNQATHLARLYWDPIVDNAEIAHADRVGFESWLIENQIGETVYVWGEAAKRRKGRQGTTAGWLGVGPDDLNGVHRYTVRLDPQTPSNRVIEVRTHTELLAQRLESRDDAITALGGNPDEVERAWRLYDLKQDPAIAQKLRDLTFQALGTIDRKRMSGAPADVGSPSPGGNGAAPGAGLGPTLGQVFTPGQNGQPLVPTPPGAVTGAGQGAGVPAGPIAGMPAGVVGPPGNAEPGPGQGPVRG